MLEKIKNEPVLVSELVKAVILVATAFGLHMSADQVASIMLLVGAVLAISTRNAVTPMYKLQKELEDQPENYDFDEEIL